jgi:O-antigen/teichoic acid export membrane protein
LPFLLNSTFTTGIVAGRQSAAGLAIVKTIANLAAALLVVGLVGVFALGLWGAVVAFTLAAVILAVALLAWARRVVADPPSSALAAYRSLLGFGLQVYPGTLANWLAHRVDVYLLAWLLTDAAAPLGYYSMAVGMAEIVLLVPGSVSAFFFPHVAGSTREVSDRQVTLVARVTLLLTGAAALAVVPVALLLIRTFLPAFEPSLPALYILLPGVVAIALSQVLAGYVAGLDRPAVTSRVGIMTLVVNVILNLILIPPFGILGASAASLLAYTLSSVVYSVIAARLTGNHPLDFWIPRRSDVRFVFDRGTAIVRRLLRR